MPNISANLNAGSKGQMTHESVLPITVTSSMHKLVPLALKEAVKVLVKGSQYYDSLKTPAPQTDRLVFKEFQPIAVPASQPLDSKTSQIPNSNNSVETRSTAQGNVSKIDLDGRCRVFFPGTIDDFKKYIASGKTLIFNVHGLSETSKEYDPSAFKSDGLQKHRDLSRGDLLLQEGYLPVSVSNKLDPADPKREFVQQNKGFYTPHGVTAPVVESVEKVIEFCKQIGQPLGQNQIVLAGKSRGAFAVTAALKQLLDKHEVAAKLCLEASVLNMKFTTEVLAKVSSIVQENKILFTEKLLADLTNLEQSEISKMFNFPDALQDLSKTASELNRNVEIVIARYQNDFATGSKEINDLLTAAFIRECNIVQHNHLMPQENSILFGNDSIQNSVYQNQANTTEKPLKAALFVADGNKHGLNEKVNMMSLMEYAFGQEI